jgi:maleylacetate reductase
VSRLVRFGAGALADLGDVAAELGLERLLLVATRRGAEAVGGLPVDAVFDGVRPHVPVETVQAAASLAREEAVDGLVGLGGGSAIDTCKAVTAELLSERELRTIAVPTTYAGAEWTSFYGMLLSPGRKGGGSAELTKPVAAIYDPTLTLSLSVGDTVGTAMNALAHCAEAYYTSGRTDRGDRNADTGAIAIAYALPLVADRPDWLYARTRLLEGAFRAALALEEAGLALGHAMAQALGGRYGLPQGAMNAVCLPAALRFNEPVVPEAVARFGRAIRADEPAERVRELARLGGFERLRDFGVPEADLGDTAVAIVQRLGAKRNPRPASAEEVEELLRSIW